MFAVKIHPGPNPLQEEMRISTPVWSEVAQWWQQEKIFDGIKSQAHATDQPLFPNYDNPK
jgi:hypothetical protein